MKHAIAVALVLASAGAAVAQSYQTALPLVPAERRALNKRLSEILSTSQPDHVTRFSLPGGRTVSVLPYRAVNRPGRPPCRGYRLDLEGNGGRTAVDGFRCQRRNGERWVIVEPELILAQEGPQYPTERIPRNGRDGSEPLYPSNDTFASAEDERDTPPVPRPSPRGDEGITTASAQPSSAREPDVSPDAGPQDDTFAGRVGALLRDEPAAEEPAADQPAEAKPTPPAAAPEPDKEPETTAEPEAPAAPSRPRETTVASATPTTAPTRVVSQRDDEAEADFSRNADVVASLQDLQYLSADEPATREKVEKAVGEFAVDERFALPVSVDVLIARLDSAIERSETLPDCTIAALRDLCAIKTD